MMKYVLSIFYFTACISMQAQFGIRTSFGSSKFEDWRGEAYALIEDKDGKFLNKSASVSLDYWFRLKKRRIEFLPQLGYTKYLETRIGTNNYSASSIDLLANVNVYLLDLTEDCNCPTFSKQGNLVKKGFFVFVAPMAKFFNLNATNENLTGKESNLGLGIRAGLGLDIGVNDLLTITPMFGYERTARLSWQNMTQFTQPGQAIMDVDSDFGRISGELRIGFRFDQGKGKFKRR